MRQLFCTIFWNATPEQLLLFKAYYEFVAYSSPKCVSGDFMSCNGAVFGARTSTENISLILSKSISM